MKTLYRLTATLLLLVVLLFLAQWLASESGEVVVLSSVTADGARAETRLWVVDHEGYPWLRAGSADAQWLARLEGTPEVSVDRAGVRTNYIAVPVPGEADAINRLMRDKYGYSDRFIGFLYSRDGSVPVRLVSPER